MTVEPQSFGAWLRRQRLERDLTQHALATLVGCSTITIRQFESHMRRPSTPLLQRLLLVLQIPDAQHTDVIALARTRGAPRPAQSGGAPSRSTSYPPAAALPTPLTRLLGRDQDVAVTAALLRQASVRLLTLTGPAGVGKTRLSLQLADQLQADFRDGVVVVALAPLTSSLLVPACLLHALALTNDPHGAVLDRLIDHLRPRQMLLVLDNCEHVLDAAPAITALLAAAPATKVLATSRERLGVYGEYEYSVSPLESPARSVHDARRVMRESPAVQLFLERVQAVNPRLRLDPVDYRRVAQLCADLDGVPLALEIVAAQVRWRSLATIHNQLARLLPTLSRPLRDGDIRHQSLWHALEWSYRLLSPALQHVFACLSVFRGPWTLEAATAIVGNTIVEATLESSLVLLAQKHLLRYRVEADTARYDMLYVVREYAAAHLAAHDDAAAVCERHAQYYAQRATQFKRQGPQNVTLVAQEQLHVMHADLQAALDWLVHTNPAAAVQLVDDLGWFWSFQGYYTAIRPLLERLSAQCHTLSSRDRIVLLRWLRQFLPAQVLPDRSLAHGLTLSEELQDWRLHAKILNDLGGDAYNRGRYAEAERYWTASLLAWDRLQDDESALVILSNLSELMLVQAAFPEALAYYRQAAAKLNPRMAPRRYLRLLDTLGQLQLHRGELAAAEATLREACLLAQQHGEQWQRAQSLYGLACAAWTCGDIQAALAHTEQSLTLLYDLQLEHMDIVALELCAALALALAQRPVAIQLFQRACHQRLTYDLAVAPIDAERHHALCEALAADGVGLAEARTWYTPPVSSQQVRALVQALVCHGAPVDIAPASAESCDGSGHADHRGASRRTSADRVLP